LWRSKKGRNSTAILYINIGRSFSLAEKTSFIHVGSDELFLVTIYFKICHVTHKLLFIIRLLNPCKPNNLQKYRVFFSKIKYPLKEETKRRKYGGY